MGSVRKSGPFSLFVRFISRLLSGFPRPQFVGYALHSLIRGQTTPLLDVATVSSRTVVGLFSKRLSAFGACVSSNTQTQHA